jgi:hypothetical protein
MSRPPIHRLAPSPRGAEDGRYFGPDFGALVALAETVARDHHGIEIPAKGRGLARTLIELPALVAHVLGEHQSLYAREAYLGSALEADNLGRHARRLAYSPDPGVAATGLAAFTVKPGLMGILPKGYALQSSPLGEAKAETYETLAEAHLDAAWNAILPAAAEVADPVHATAGRIELGLEERHGLEEGEIVLLRGRGRVGVFRVVDAFDGARPPRIGLHNIGGHGFADQGTEADWAAGYFIAARPKIEARLFGWNAQAALWPASALAVPGGYTAPPTTTAGTLAFGYEAPPSANAALMLAEAIVPPVVASRVAVIGPTLSTPFLLATPYQVGQTGETVATFVRGEVVQQPQVVATTPATNPPSVTVVLQNRLVETRLSARVTTLALQVLPGLAAKTWNSFPLDSRVLADWSKEIAVTKMIRSAAGLQPEFTVAADLSAMRPGRAVILRRRSTGEVHAATVAAVKAPGEVEEWSVVLEVAGGFPAGWELGDVELLANVLRVSHGETKTEIVGSSDGVTPHQVFALKKAPVTRLPGALGAEIALDLRVDGVLWDRAEDFHDQGPDARIYTTETAADGTVTVRFGGEGRGAIPPAGRRNVTADYREGLGVKGNAGAGRVSRIRKSSPLLAAVSNPLAILGGTDAAGAVDIARQAVRPVKVFDRAVSVEDHADLALLFPSIVRAAARWLDAGGIELVAADAEGNGPADTQAFMAFLDARRDTGMPLTIVAPQAVGIALELRVERDPAWLAEAVRLAVEEALLGGASRPGLFTFAGRELSGPQSLSGIYARLLDLPGVAAVEAVRFQLAATRVGGGQRLVADIIHASTRQWLRLEPSSLTIQMVEPGLLDRALTGGGAP